MLARGVALFLGLLALVLLAPVASAKVAKGAETSPEAIAPSGDRDGSGVFDDLERRLRVLGPNSPVDVIVTLRGPASTEQVAALERGVGRFELRSRFRVVDAFAARVSKRQVEALARRPEVERVEPDAQVKALNHPEQEGFGVTRARLDAPYLDGNRDGNRATYSNRDMVAAVVDTGIHRAHRDLDEGKVLAFVDCTSGSCRGRTAFDDNGHGTHIAATIAGEGDARGDRLHRGAAPDGALVGVKSLGSDGTGARSSVVAGIDWAVANRSRYRIRVVNLSLGAIPCSDGTDAMSRAANRAASAGLLVVAAAGNDGPRRCTVTSPGAASGALAVGSMFEPREGGFLASWKSSRGSSLTPIKPDLMAPGQGVASARTGTTTGYTTKEGTSQAAGFASGVALLMFDANPALTAGQVKGRLKNRAIDWGIGGASRDLTTRGPDIDFGSGRLDAYRALQSAGVSALTNPPPVPAHVLRTGSFSSTAHWRDYPLDIADRCAPIAASLIMSGWYSYTAGPDFDIALFDPDGNQVAVDDTVERQNDVTHAPAKIGRYTLRVTRHQGSGNYFVDVSAGLSPPPAGAPASCSS